MAGSPKYYDLPPNYRELKGLPTYSAPVTDSGPTTDNPNIEAACQECEQYQLKVNVVTRLGGIPVKGIKYEVWKNYEYQSFNPSSFDNTAKNMKLKITYANEVARMKTETVTIELKNLTPLSCAVKGAVAYFEHIILKIRDVNDDSAEPILQEKSAKFSQISTELETLNTDCMYGSTAKLDILHTASKELFTAENNADANFLDKYKVTASKYKNLSENNTSDSHLIESTFEVEMCENGIIIFHLNVSLATFSLDVPYMNQNIGAVKLTEVKGSISNIRITGEPAENPKIYNNAWPIWSSDALCAPTIATMILEYCDILLSEAIDKGYQTSENDTNMHADFRARFVAKIYCDNYPTKSEIVDDDKDAPWEDEEKVKSLINRIFSASNNCNVSSNDNNQT